MGFVPGVDHLYQLSDVSLSNPATSDYLKFDNTSGLWQNAGLAEAVQDVVGASLVAGTNITISYNDPAGTITINSTGGSGDPAMGGDLSGTASTASLNPGVVAAAELASNAVTTVKIADNNVTEPKLSISNSPTTNQILSWSGSTMTWITPTAGAVAYSDLPAGSTITVAKVSGTWPARPTSRTDIIVQWKGPDPSPSIVSSGTGGMMDNVDIRFVTP